MQRELQTKLDRLRRLMAEKSLDALYLKRQDSFAWLTLGGINYVGLGDMGNCGLLVTQDALHAITNVIEAPRMRDEEKLEELGDAYVLKNIQNLPARVKCAVLAWHALNELIRKEEA